jgi:hypothetical protein
MVRSGNPIARGTAVDRASQQTAPCSKTALRIKDHASQQDRCCAADRASHQSPRIAAARALQKNRGAFHIKFALRMTVLRSMRCLASRRLA